MNKPPHIPPEIELLVTKSVGAAKDELRAAIDKMRADSESAGKQLVRIFAAICVVTGAVAAVVGLLGSREIVTRIVQEKLKEATITDLKNEATIAASNSTYFAKLSKDAAKEANDRLAAIRKRQAESAGYAVITDKIAQSQIDHTQETAVPLPAEVPPTATEVLVYCYADSGSVPGTSKTGQLAISTLDANSRRTTLSLFIKTYEQSAVSFNSDHFWLPYPTNRNIAAKIEGLPKAGNYHATVEIVGYR